MQDIDGPTLWQRLRRPSTLVFLGAGLLAADPLRWLVATWTDATYNPEGLWVALTVAVLALWSFSSALRREPPDTTRALWLLGVAASVRAAGQLLGVNVIGAMTLALDVFAVATLAGLAHRRRAVSPGWLAALFALSLPLERVLQRAVGYGLQQLSAGGACSALGLLDFNVVCKGTRILLDGQDLLVDLPCSGARGLILLLTLYCAACAVTRPDVLRAARGFLLTLAAAWAANVLRLVLLALGLARGVPVMEAPWHELTGLVTLALGAAPILWWACRSKKGTDTFFAHRSVGSDLPQGKGVRPLFPFLFVACALVIVNLPARPVDVARAMPAPVLPGALGEWTAKPLPLSAVERAYFTRYGGAAARAAYGPHGLLLVSTSAPLRHLHAPDECLRNSGHDVRYVGVRRGAMPTAIYRTVDTEGQRWRVAVSYVSSDGQWATSVAEAAWYWLARARKPFRTPTWTMVQRIAPWDLPEADGAAWDAAVARALDLPPEAGSEDTLHRTPTDLI